MKEYNVKQYPITLTGMGGGVGALRYNFASGSGVDVQTTTNAPLNIGSPFTRNNGNYFTYMEFQSSGSVLLLQHLWGEWKYNLSTPYDVSASSISYQANSARYWTICGYKNDALAAYKVYSGRVMRFDYNNDKAYFYNGNGATSVVEDLDVYTQTTPTLVSASNNPFSTSPNTYSNSCTNYVKKPGGGLAYVQFNSSDKKIYLRNYANETTSTVSSYSVLDTSSYDISNYGMRLGLMSASGTTISVFGQRNTNTSLYDIHKWTLSTPFDLSTAGSHTATNQTSTSIYWNENGTVVNDGSGKAVGWDQYGTLYQYAYTTDGDINTPNFSRPSQLDRTANGAYHNGSSYVAYCDDGKKVIDMGYSSTHYVYDSTSNPYGWQFHDGDFGNNRSSNRTGVYTSNSNEGQTFSDGRFNADRSKLYSSFYSSTYRVTERNLSTPGDISTLSGSYSGHNSETTFTGWSGGYWQHAAWYDKLNNKFPLVDTGGGTYFIFNLNAAGEFDGTWNASPTGFSSGDFSGMSHLQPLSHNGKYFTYIYTGQQDCYILELDYPFEPARGYTQVKKFDVEFNLPNGTKRQDSSYSRMYVSGGRIFFANYYNTNITAVIDVTIDGKAPDDITNSAWPFDLSTASFDGKAPHYNYTGQVNSNTTGFFLKPDGTAFYTMNSSDDKVRRHNMTTAWDITTCSYNSVSGSGLTHPGGGPSKGLYFKSDGTKLFYIDTTHIRAYNLSTAWDITTLSAASDSHDFSSNLAGASSSLNFKPDGTKFYISETSGSTNNYILEYNLSTAWDLSTASYVHKDNCGGELDANTTNNIRGFGFGNNGSYVNISSAANTYGRRLSLSTPWDISTLSTSNAQWTQHYHLTSGFYGYGLNWQWKSDGLQYYFMGDNDEVIHEMKPTTAWSVGNANSGNENNFKNAAYYADFCHPYKLFGIQSNYSLRWVNDGNKIAYTGGYSTYLYSASTPYDMKTLSTSGRTYKSLSGVGYGPQEQTYNSAGTVMFWGPEIQYKEVKQYNLSTAWDASSINTTPAHTLDLTAGGGPSSVNCGTVSDDGKYIYAAYSSTIYQWTLSTPFDLSTASYTHSQSGFESSSGSVKISPDGTQLLQMKGTTIKSYTLGTAFNIQTASYDNKSCTIDHTLSTMIPEGFSWNACMHVVPVAGAAKLTFMPYYGAIGISISFS